MELAEWMEKNFAYFCRRVCRQCHRTDTTALMLEACPIIKLDAFAFLKLNHPPLEVPKRLGAAVSAIVTKDLTDRVWHASTGPNHE